MFYKFERLLSSASCQLDPLPWQCYCLRIPAAKYVPVHFVIIDKTNLFTLCNCVCVCVCLHIHSSCTCIAIACTCIMCVCVLMNMKSVSRLKGCPLFFQRHLQCVQCYLSKYLLLFLYLRHYCNMCTVHVHACALYMYMYSICMYMYSTCRLKVVTAKVGCTLSSDKYTFS